MTSPADELETIVQRGLAAYRAGLFYEAHELWEVGWRAEPHPARRAFLQGLILVAAAMHKLTRMRSPSGAVRLLSKAHARLAGVPDGMGGVDVGLLRDDLDRAARAIERRAREGRTELDASVLPRMEAAGERASAPGDECPTA
ncbi:hypothetical protein SOCEGT47_028790 [Sorangium cellulosum]|jgi:predicted metal-dependent hydrolase|uniref:DUF309 domain-containing protein n=1 Tax=Sorangium cellulosum TaxID=56 RepID=A0A4P2Q0D6_SORCE|nr:DUF309 domain-containing protein [Sorangium cellulosum]AUX22378.1 hypothetical protein SOCEGT47_028790 [Sorangium cellulosum]